MSGIRMISLAPTAVADALTTSASPAGVGSPLGSCCPPGAIWTTEFMCSGYSSEFAGTPGWDSAYNPPAARWVTGRNGAAALTVMTGTAAATEGIACAAGAAGAAASDATVAVAANSTNPNRAMADPLP